jgi:FKBP-type peptidyl-prolyl cis-trans isomerase
MRRLYLAGLVLIGSTAACTKDKEAAPLPPSAQPAVMPATAGGSIEQTTFASSLGVDIRGSTKNAAGLYSRDVTVGTGTLAAPGSQVTVRYALYLPDGTLLEESPVGDPGYQFVIGTHSAIDGWDQGVPGMKVGGKRQIIVPPSLGYGAMGQGKVPGNAVLIFNLELMAVK